MLPFFTFLIIFAHTIVISSDQKHCIIPLENNFFTTKKIFIQSDSQVSDAIVTIPQATKVHVSSIIHVKAEFYKEEEKNDETTICVTSLLQERHLHR